jgi:hypothetical protein
MPSPRDPIAFGASLGPRVFLIRSTPNLPHREATAEWAQRHGGWGLVVCPKACERAWHDAWPGLGEADVMSHAAHARHHGGSGVEGDYVIFEEPSLNQHSKQFAATLATAKRKDNVLVSVVHPMRNDRRGLGSLKLIVEAKLTPVVM